jgi:hypothetical protein
MPPMGVKSKSRPLGGVFYFRKSSAEAVLLPCLKAKKMAFQIYLKMPSLLLNCSVNRSSEVLAFQ